MTRRCNVAAADPHTGNHRLIPLAFVAALAVTLGPRVFGQQPGVPAQESNEADSRSLSQRRVQIPQGAGFPAVVMTEFFTMGELDPKAPNLSVQDSRRNAVPCKILQVGPGDVCRIAFQTIPKQTLYRISYGKGPAEVSPVWTASAGLVLETRRAKTCDFNQLASVREAWKTAEPYGSAYVPAVFHRFNPFCPDPQPFLSEYRGTLRVASAGHYRFFTSSQDCSFLLIDEKLVVAAPGWHGPVADARFKGEVDLQAGTHEFRYIHAASGPHACMVAAWQPPGAGKPVPIPPEAFGSDLVARYPAVSVKHLHEFAAESLGEVPIADSEHPLVRVQFRFVSSRGSSTRPRVHWDFGDGQTSTLTDPVHIYLHPGLYRVTMKVPGESETLATVNRVPIVRSLVFADEMNPGDQLSAYLPVLDKYAPARLDATGLLQLIRALDQAGLPARAVKAAQGAILVDREPMDSEESLALVRLAGGLLRNRMGDSSDALALWQGAVKVLKPEPWKAECEIEAADLALNELLQVDTPRGLLESAAARLGQGGDSVLRSRLDRVRGDWAARKGDRASARAAYARAQAAVGSRKSAVEEDAWRGALSRSTEEFLRGKALDRAWTELSHWQEQFPIDKVEGYLTLLQARYWAARGRWPLAIALAGDLVAVNPDSPYADRLAFLAADCEEKQGRSNRALAAYQSLVTDYPGSPLVAEAKAKIEALTNKQTEASRKPSK
jgi:tetratricopeptide (TPR) repeat protein